MTAFDAQTAGTSETAWRRCEWLHDAREFEPPRATGLLVLVAHPDDETLGAGGLIGSVAETGVEVHVIVASDGAASHPNSPSHSPAQLAALRRGEVAQAVFALAPKATLDYLGLPDGDLGTHEDELRATLHGACHGQSLVLAPWAYDRHPDHEACARAARSVAAQEPALTLLEFPVWAWHWGDPAADPVDLDPAIAATRRFTLDVQCGARKRAAIACYPSQTASLSPEPGDEAVLTSATLEYFTRDYECFFQIDATRI
jgi:LmbE family N-acetylglucosaminyl deacetylase